MCRDPHTHHIEAPNLYCSIPVDCQHLYYTKYIITKYIIASIFLNPSFFVFYRKRKKKMSPSIKSHHHHQRVVCVHLCVLYFPIIIIAVCCCSACHHHHSRYSVSAKTDVTIIQIDAMAVMIIIYQVLVYSKYFF